MSKSGSSKEQLASLCTDMKWLKEAFDNHLAHHWAFNIILLTAVIGEAIGFIILVIKHVL
jgi:hypothetical protein